MFEVLSGITISKGDEPVLKEVVRVSSDLSRACRWLVLLEMQYGLKLKNVSID